MAELPNLPRKKSYAVLGSLALFAAMWAGEDILDELKAKAGWSWLEAASTVFEYGKIIGLALVFVSALVAAAAFIRLLLKPDEESQRERLIAAPAADAASAPAADWDVLEYLSASAQQDAFQGETLNIPDLIAPDDPVVRNKTFIDCNIVGPATIEFTASRPGTFAMTGCTFSDTDAVLYRADARSQTGISFEDCRFVQCRFYKTLLLFPADAYDSANAFIEGLNWITEPPPRPDPRQPPPPTPEPSDVLTQAFRQMEADEEAQRRN